MKHTDCYEEAERLTLFFFFFFLRRETDTLDANNSPKMSGTLCILVGHAKTGESEVALVSSIGRTNSIISSLSSTKY